MRLHNKVAVITGAATGIGQVTALLFAREGAKLVLTDVDEQGLAETLAQVREVTADVIAIKHDVSSEEDWIGCQQQAEQRFGRVDVLFNNAAIYKIKPLVEITLEEWNQLMAINVTGVFLGMKHILPLMMKHKSGSVINASSLAGLVGGKGHALYGASKGAVRTLTKDAAAEYAQYNIRINSIHPGYIKTAMVEYAAEQSHKSLATLAESYPMRRLGEREEVAKTVLFLASDDASYTTGSEFLIDGGARNLY